MSYEEEILENIQHNTLAPDDTFQFTCKECGSCCRNRRTPVMLSGLDVYRIAKGMGLPPYEVLARFTSGHLGHSTHAPVVVLRERLDGSCSLLRKGKCTVHAFKPIACAVHPLGRYVDLSTGESAYIQQPGGCSGESGGRQWSLSEWIATWGLNELDEQSIAWGKMAGVVGGVMHRFSLDKIDRATIWVLYQYMYGEYNPSRDFIPQVEENSEALRKYFKEQFKIKVDFK